MFIWLRRLAGVIERARRDRLTRQAMDAERMTAFYKGARQEPRAGAFAS